MANQIVLISGNGTLSWIDVNEDDYQLQQINLQGGDIYRLQPLTVFYMENNLESDEALQICALFPDSEQELQNKQLTGVYVGVHDLVLGFDNKVLQAILSVPEEVVQELKGGERQPLIVQIQPEANNSILEVNSRVIRAFLGLTKNSNILDLADHDFDNDNGWSVTVTSEHFDVLKDSNFGVFMVNLTEGSMNGPHLNPASAQLAIVQRGPGMVQVVCPSIPSETICKNSRFKVEEGDVFVVPRYHLMAQMSFNNESFVFVGFTMTSKKNPPQYLAGKKSFLQTLDKTVLAKSFDIRNMTMMDEVLSTEEVSIILECKSCAEDQKKLMEEEAVWERVDIGGDKVSHWGDMEGDSRGWQWAESEGEMARRQEEDMQRRLMVAEQAAKRARRAMATKRAAAQEGCSCESRYPMKANRTVRPVHNLKTLNARFKSTETSFEAFPLRLKRRKPRGGTRRKIHQILTGILLNWMLAPVLNTDPPNPPILNTDPPDPPPKKTNNPPRTRLAASHASPPPHPTKAYVPDQPPEAPPHMRFPADSPQGAASHRFFKP
ncbi:rmlC-like jelly roll fold protein [Artemisia annua]|uniref:RmlC-like jelly roll fold protein n=1 Tax=Artemisia annua TaxID=35608 RepID=A0A2U1QCU2_ARTAN|nr:rmlC-like jelly roll fold protein [Artemisia annua]